MTTPFERKILAYLSIILAVLIFLGFLIDRLVKQLKVSPINSTIVIIGILGASTLLVLIGVSLHREAAKYLEAKKRLREREQELRLALNLSNAGLWNWDLHSNRFNWSDENYKVFGYQPRELEPTYDIWANCLHSEDRERVKLELDNAIRERRNFKTEHRIVRPDGEVHRILVRGQAEYDGDGSPTRIGGINIDVTELRAAEEALYESEERFRQIAENIEAVLWIRNAKTGKLEFISPSIESLWGISPEKLMSGAQLWSEFIHPEDREVVEKSTREGLTTVDLEQEYRIFTPDQEQRWVRDRAFRVRDRNGNVSRIVGFIIDTTERKVLEEIKAKLLAGEQEARARAEAANRMKDEFLAVVSHELRSPLNAMLGWARVLRSKEIDKQTHDHAIQVIELSAEVQSRLIEDLLDSSRIASGNLRIDSRPINLISVIQSAVDTVHPTAANKSVEIHTDLDANSGIITGDPERLQQIVWNLLSNAVKFTPQGGQVMVNLKRRDPWVTMTVKDTGQGIKAEEIARIFESFHQADTSTTRRAGGLGLGLSLVKNLVELHGGEIEAQSEGEGKGTIFTINLPLRAVSSPVTDEKGITPRKGRQLQFPQVLSGLKILAVDDEAQARDLISTLLGKYGAVVTSVSSGAEAIEMLTNMRGEERIDLIVSDIGMPGQDGYMLMRRIRKLPDPVGRIPAVALTAYGRSEDRIQALESGFQMHVSKPVEPTELMLVIASLTGRSLKIAT